MLNVALAQMNAVVGDIDGNAARIAGLAARARDQGAQLVVFPELALTGYPPEDLLLKAHFRQAAEDALTALAGEIDGITAVVGYPQAAEGVVHNAAAVIEAGAVRATYRKQLLPNYAVFDERRYFEPGAEPCVVEVAGMRLGVTICEDVWAPGPSAAAAAAGAEAILNLSASPYHLGKGSQREALIAARARENGLPVVLCNMVGGQDELVFDGHSAAVDSAGELFARAPQFEEALAPLALEPGGGTGTIEPLLAEEAEVYGALVLGLRDYVEKNGFRQVGVGLSGGIDSALAAIVSVDALGAEAVTCVVMPSPYSSAETQDDARAIARNLGAGLVELGIAEVMEAYERTLAAEFAGTEPDIAEENLQARARGNLLMALSNKFGWLIVATGNKSELSVGYATLYGDMAGGYALLKDLFKGWVYRLVRWRNDQADAELVPASVLDRPPSAELRHEQRDDQSLPAYDVLDAILAGYVEQDLDAEELVARGLPRAEVERVIALVDRAEYKRRQAPPGVRITQKAFGRDRRLPITNRFRG